MVRWPTEWATSVELEKNVKKLLLLGLVGILSCAEDVEEPYVRPPKDSDEPWVLVDVYHTTKQNPVDYRLDKDEFGYQGVFGFWRAFEHLKNNDYNWTAIRTEPFSAPRLEGFDVIFINLLSEDRPDFTDEEIDVILEFVENGGGLFVIADHTNVYRHAERINRFLIPMGIEVTYHTATDQPPEYAVAGLGWTLTWDFVPHPVTQDLEMISLQTGGPMISESGGLAFTSEGSFADYWDPNAGGGLFGNWRWDGINTVHTLTLDEEITESARFAFSIEGVPVEYTSGAEETPAEIVTAIAEAINATSELEGVVTATPSQNTGTVRIKAVAEWKAFESAWTEGPATLEETLPLEALEKKGPLEVVAAEEYGQGRVVVAGDQNMFGDAWLHFGDNFEFFMNAMEWAAKMDGAETPLRDIKPMGINIGLYQTKTNFKAGRNSNEGFFAFFTNANRDLDVTARATTRLEATDDIMFVMTPEEEFTQDELTALSQYARDGKKLVVTFSPDQINQVTTQVLQHVAPGFDLNGRTLDDPTFGANTSSILTGPLPALSDKLDVAGLEIADYEEGEDSAARIFNITSTWGESLVQAGETDVVDVARTLKTPEGGEIIIWMQDGMFRGRSMGSYLGNPKEWNRPQIELHYRLFDYLKRTEEE